MKSTFLVPALVAVLAQSAALAAPSTTVRSAVAINYSRDPDSFPCWEAEADARRSAAARCAEDGYDGDSNQIGDGEKISSGLLLRDNPSHLPYLEHGYRTFCKVRVVVSCKNEVPPPPSKPFCFIQEYSSRTLFGHVTRWALKLKTGEIYQTLQKGFTSYTSAWDAGKAMQAKVGCELVTGFPRY